MGLIAAGLERHPAVTRAVRYLTVMQNEDGTWDEPEFTGTGFPQVYYLRYHYYPIYFPLLALSQWALKVNPKQTDNELTALRQKTPLPETVLRTKKSGICFCPGGKFLSRFQRLLSPRAHSGDNWKRSGNYMGLMKI